MRRYKYKTKYKSFLKMEIICYEILYPLCMNEGQQCSLSERCQPSEKNGV